MATGTPFALVILDGWGIADPGPGNAIAQAATPNLDRCARSYPWATLHASGIDVGLMWAVGGNSETGHLNIGSGRVVYQQLPRILLSIQQGHFRGNPALRSAVAWARHRDSTLHLAGLYSSGTVHGFVDILYALLDFTRAEGLSRVALHLWLDGRDCFIRESGTSVPNLEHRLRSLHHGAIASVMGRSFAMDRNGNWDRTQRAYACMTGDSGRKITDISAYLQANYALGLTDEFIEPSVVVDGHGKPVGAIQPDDALILFNFRADRMRQITEAFSDPSFTSFPRQYIENLKITTMGDYGMHTPVDIAYPTDDITDTLAEILSRANLRQLHIAETEKYAHVTYFFNGRRETPFPGEDRIIIPSSHDVNFDAAPEMQAAEISARVIDDIRQRRHDVYVVNLANADMVGHTGNIPATVKAIEACDRAVGGIIQAILEQRGVAMITGDHGNAEELMDRITGQPRREHSRNPVPLYLIGERYRRNGKPHAPEHALPPIGRLADITPTILEILDLHPPKAMTGTNLLPKLLGAKTSKG